MSRSTTTFVFGGDRTPAQVIPFPPPTQRRHGRDADDGAPRAGRILLFTGVRYERIPDTRATAPAPQRKRS